MRYIYLILLLVLQYNCGSDGGSPTLDVVVGCIEPEACNYQPDATQDGNPSLCWYPNNYPDNDCECDDGENATMDCNGVCGGSDVFDCNNECGGSANIDDCNVCSGGSTGILINECACSIPENTIAFYPNHYISDYGTWGMISYNTSSDIGSFSFNIDNITFTPSNGAVLNNNYYVLGDVDIYDFDCTNTPDGNTTNNNEMYFSCEVDDSNSLSSYIPAGCDILTLIHYQINFDDVEDEIDFSNLSFYDPGGEQINISFYDTCENASYDCAGICGGDAVLDECFICNGNGLNDDGCCGSQILDCSSVCGGSDTECLDCNGDIDGTAYEDVCGICVGGNTGLTDCLYECDDCNICDNDPTNNCVVDCFGEENGDAVVDECGICGGDGIPNNNCDCFGNTLDECGICGGDNTTCIEDYADGCDLPLNGVHLTDNGVVLYNVSTPIAGFQWTLDGATATGASGGDATDAGFTVSASGTTVLGFSFAGNTVPSGCGTLVNLSLNGIATGLTNIVFSDSSGTQFDVTYYANND